MGARIRSVDPPEDDGTLEELVAEPTATDGPPRGGAAQDPRPVRETFRLDDHRPPLAAADLGPNGDVVLDLLARAGRLTPDERRRLDKEAAWRWGIVTPVPGVASMPAARARALVLGRADGRSDAIVALEASVAALLHAGARSRTRSLLHAAISNAGLALLVRDLIDSETFETLSGPWREVMHH